MTKSKTLLGLLVLAGLVMLVSAMEWVSAIGQGIMASPVQLSISGLSASPLITAAVLVVVSATLAAAISAPGARRVALGIAGLGGFAVFFAPMIVGEQAERIAQSAAMSETSVSELVSDPTVSPLRFAVTGLGLLIVLLAIAGVRASGDWGQSRSRYERTADTTAPVAEPSESEDTGDLIDLWDSQTAELGQPDPADPGTLD